MSETIFICEKQEKSIFSFRLINQMAHGRLCLLTNEELHRQILKVILSDAYGLEFRHKTIISPNSGFTKTDINIFLNKIRIPKGVGPSVTFHNDHIDEIHKTFIENTINFIEKDYRKENLSEVFKYFKMMCIWNLENNVTIYCDDKAHFERLLFNITAINNNIKFVPENKLPVW